MTWRETLRRFTSSPWYMLVDFAVPLALGLVMLRIASGVNAARDAERASQAALENARSELQSERTGNNHLADALAACRSSQRPEARCRAEGGMPAMWSDGFTQCWSNTDPRQLMWSSK